jgi:very-short-patch-repair endonuclease
MGEMRVNFNKEDKLRIGKERVCMFVDFRYKNKIVEFNGTYWHSKTQQLDDIRDEILKSKDYEILRISEGDYNNNEQKEVDKCIQFLKN